MRTSRLHQHLPGAAFVGLLVLALAVCHVKSAAAQDGNVRVTHPSYRSTLSGVQHPSYHETVQGVVHPSYRNTLSGISHPSYRNYGDAPQAQRIPGDTPPPEDRGEHDVSAPPSSTPLFMPEYLEISLQTPAPEDLQGIILNFSLPTGAAQCRQLGELILRKWKSARETPYLNITVDGFVDKTPPPPACPASSADPSGGLLITKKDLEDITQIHIHIRHAIERYNIFFDGRSLSIEPENALRTGPETDLRRSAAGEDNSPFFHWFYPPNTVVLFVPQSQGPVPEQAFKTAAFSANLRPLDMALPGFSQPASGMRYYAVDPSGRLAATDAPSQVGLIRISDTRAQDQTKLYGQNNAWGLYARPPAPYE